MSTPRLIGEIFFVRHGHSAYTELFPDLTKEGIKAIKEAAKKIGKLIAKYFYVFIISSPAVCAQGTAKIIQREIGHEGEIKIEPAVKEAEVRDSLDGKEIFKRYMASGGLKALSVAYGIDSRYENPRIFEPRSLVKARFFEYFSDLIRRMFLNSMKHATIIVSHYETLYHLVEEPFDLNYKNDDPLKPGEIIAVSVFDVELQNIVEIAITFRGKTVKRNFDYSSCEMR